MSDNPLLALQDPTLSPDYRAIRPEHAEPAIRQLIDQHRLQVDALLERAGAQPDWASLVEPLECLADDLERVWSPVRHLFSVCNTPHWQAAYQACQPLITAWGLEQAQNPRLYAAYRALAAREDFATLPAARRRVVENALRAFRHGGAELEGEARQRFTAVCMRLSELQTQFEQNLIDATDRWSLCVEQESRLQGIPRSALQRARERAQAAGRQGWLFGLDFPSYDAVISHARDRELRETVYRAYVTRASDGDTDNTPLIDEILALRREEAALLGARSYADLALEDRMARSVDEIEKFLLELAERARPRATEELARLRALARELDGVEPLQAFDLPYYSERLRERELGLDEEALRPYFAFESVLDGMLRLAGELFGVHFEAIADAPSWHPEVRSYRLRDADGEVLGEFHLDPFAREGKRSGAWMDGARNRHFTAGKRQRPVAYLVCNFSPPSGGEPSQLTHDEVLTLFHEFGHGLHHLLTEVDEVGVSGINGVAWDAVELPSQFMENWCYEPEVLQRFARHFRSGEPIPDADIAQLRAARRFLSGMATLRQVEFALFDLRLHASTEPVVVRECLRQVREAVSVFPPPDFNRFENSFSHIFAGGYAAGYYSYKWAEVLSSDAFEEAPSQRREIAARFRRTILARGGSQPAAELFEAFRGRPPRIDALLRHEGLDAPAAGVMA